MRHFDLHTGNVFTLNGESTIMDAVLVDSGHTRLPGESAPAYTAWEWNLMESKDHWGYSSHPGTYGPVNEVEDRKWRLPLDLSKFLYNFHEDFEEHFDEEGNSLLFELFKRLSDKNCQDDRERKLPEAQRPPVVDLTQEIQDAQTLERLYVGTRSDQEALGQLRVKLNNLVNEEPVDHPLSSALSGRLGTNSKANSIQACFGLSTFPT